MKKVLIIFLFLFVLLVPTVSAVCTVTLDKSVYSPLETVTATIQCSLGNEANQAYTILWRNSSILLETDAGTTPSGINTLFFEDFIIPSGAVYTNANTSMNGTNLEGIDTFTVTLTSPNELRVVNVTTSSNFLIGKTGGVSFRVIDSNDKFVNNARCGLDLIDETGTHLTRAKEELITYDGHATFGVILNIESLTEDNDFALFIHCNCGVNDTILTCHNEDGDIVPEGSGSTETTFHINKWLLNVNTITDKLIYNLNDKQVLVCANVTNNQTQRLPIRILYTYRCDGNTDDSTDRILLPENTVTGMFGKEQERGINPNTTQNQCAALEIQNRKTLQNRLNICYASTDVEVLTLDESRVSIAYHTTSSSFNITSNSNTFVEVQDKMASLSITIFSLILPIILFLLFMKKDLIPTTDPRKEWINLLARRCCLTISIYLMTLNATITATIAAAGGLNVLNEMFTYMVIYGWAGYIMMIIIVVKTLMDLIENLKRQADIKRYGEDND